MQVLFFAGSLRRDSFNKKYVRVAHELLKARVDGDLVDLADFLLPVFNQDIETSDFPAAAKQLATKVAASRAVIISSPENNGAIAACLKNTVDWISRVPGTVWAGKHILLMGATPGGLGAVRGLWHSRIPFEALGCHVYPEMSGLPRAGEAFAPDGSLKDAAGRERLAKLLDAFLVHAAK